MQKTDKVTINMQSDAFFENNRQSDFYFLEFLNLKKNMQSDAFFENNRQSEFYPFSY